MFCTPQTTDIKICQGKWQLPGVPKNQNQWELIRSQRLKTCWEIWSYIYIYIYISTAKSASPYHMQSSLCHLCSQQWCRDGLIFQAAGSTKPASLFQHRVGDSSDILVTVKTQCKHARKHWEMIRLPGSVEFASLHPTFEVLPQAPPRRHSLDDTWSVSMMRVDTHCYKIWVLAHEFYWNFSTKPEALAVLLWGASRQDCSDRTLTAWLSVKTSWPSTSNQNCHWYKH